MSLTRAWLTRLYQYYTHPPAVIFKKFRQGASVFFVGLVIIYSGQQLFQPSLIQEITTLAGLSFIAIGFCIAIHAHLRMIISKLLRFFFEDH